MVKVQVIKVSKTSLECVAYTHLRTLTSNVGHYLVRGAVVFGVDCSSVLADSDFKTAPQVI